MGSVYVKRTIELPSTVNTFYTIYPLTNLNSSAALSLHSSIQSDADRCVMCGLCLPHCPTYGLSGNEAESPRGRIALLLALSQGRLEADAAMAAHIYSCLGCRACEKMCPSKVEYGRLRQNGLALIKQQRGSEPESWPMQLAQSYLRESGPAGQLLRSATQVYRSSGLQQLFRQYPALGRTRLGALESLLPEKTPANIAIPEYVDAVGEKRGSVGLFTGCTGKSLDSDTLVAAIRLLSLNGFDVEIPASQACCGALAHNTGDHAQARRNRQANLDAFASDELVAIVGIASGCSATLKDYRSADERRESEQFAQRVQDVSRFLADIDWTDNLQLEPLQATVAVHVPCTLHNVLGSGESPFSLLSRIPGIKLENLAGNPACCGAAGEHVLSHPDIAKRLVKDKIDAITALRPDYLVSSNIGCALHLAAGLRTAGLAIEVIHPLTLLERQLRVTKEA